MGKNKIKIDNRIIEEMCLRTSLNLSSLTIVPNKIPDINQ